MKRTLGMRLLFLGLALFSFACTKAPGATLPGQYAQPNRAWTDSYTDRVSSLDHEFRILSSQFQNNPSQETADKMWYTANKMEETSTSLYTQAKERVAGVAGRSDMYEAQLGIGMSKICMKSSATNLLATGEAYRKINDKEKAKLIYRHIITSYLGDEFKGVSKQAEFGLEDLK